VDTPIGGTVKSFDKPEGHVAKGGVEISVVQLGDMKVRHASYPPGWKFSKDMGAPTCFETHVGYVLSGHLTAEFSDGTRIEAGPDSVFAIPAGHDAWVTGDQPFVIVQFDEGESAARRFNVHGATAKAA
jgi:hypothetical protein